MIDVNSKSKPSRANSQAGLSSELAVAQEIALLPRSQKARLAMQFLGFDTKGISNSADAGSVSRAKLPSSTKINPKIIEGILAELVKELDQKPIRSMKKPHDPDRSARPNPVADPAHPIEITPFLTHEHPSVAAFVLSSQTTSNAAALLQKLHPLRAQKIALALSDIETKRRRFPPKSGKIIHKISCPA